MAPRKIVFAITPARGLQRRAGGPPAPHNANRHQPSKTRRKTSMSNRSLSRRGVDLGLDQDSWIRRCVEQAARLLRTTPSVTSRVRLAGKQVWAIVCRAGGVLILGWIKIAGSGVVLSRRAACSTCYSAASMRAMRAWAASSCDSDSGQPKRRPIWA